MKRKIKMTLLIIASVIGIFSLSVVLFIKLSPQFGATKKEIATSQVLASENHNGKVFENAEKTDVMTEFKFSSLKEYFKKEGKEPDTLLPVRKFADNYFETAIDTSTRFTWFGHSAILLETQGKNIFIDPMLGHVPAPVSFVGPKRFNPELPISADSLPELDIVLISHDHYDHLDYESITKLKDKTKQFIVPLGVGAHLRSWGVDANKITELDWWDTCMVDGIKIAATPSRHFSGRGLSDRDATLWCSFVLQTNNENIFFSGDGGYGSHFKEIGDKYGPFDVCFMECGQYNEQWAQIHMMPEDITTANNDLRGKAIVPIHWGSFKLALHPWVEPVNRLALTVENENAILVTPEIGQTISLPQPESTELWWKRFVN